MSSPTSQFVIAADLDRISAAVHEAEKKTAGEIVPYVVGHADSYEEAEWRCGVLLGALAFALFLSIRRFTTLWLPVDLVEIIVFSLLAGGAGMLLVKYVPAVKRLFAGRALMDLRVKQRAAEAFVQEEVFKTRDRTGILIMVSLLEREVLVVGDSGINARVRQEEWQDIVKCVIDGIRQGKLAEGLVRAIGMSGTLLERQGISIKPDDTDELSDSLRVSDR